MTDRDADSIQVRRLDATGIRRLEVNWKRGRVGVVGESGGDLVAEVHGARSDEWSLELRGSVAVLRQETEIEDSFLDGRSFDVTVRVPASVAETNVLVGMGDLKVDGVRGQVDLRVGSGDVSVDAARGHLDLKSGLGAVTLRNVVGEVDVKAGRGRVRVSGAEGRLRVAAGDGDVAIVGVRAADLDLTTGRGDVEVSGDDVRSLRVKTGLGRVRCTATLHRGDHDVRTGLGDVMLALSDRTSVRVDAATGWGHVHSAFPLVRVGRPGPAIFGGQRFVGTIGAGPAEVNLKVRTGKGDIRLSHAGPATSAGQPTVPTPSTEEDPRLEILLELERGEIDVAEAERRLREISRREAT